MPAGRPRKELDSDELKRIMRFKPSLLTTAGYFDVSPKTIERRCHELGSANFGEFRHKYMADVKLKLVQTILEQAFSGNTTALIFSLKNLCGWADKVETIEAKEENYQSPETLKQIGKETATALKSAVEPESK